MSKINVLVIDDSAFMRKLIADFLMEDSRIGVVETARNGKDGLEKIKTFSPHVVTLDVEMPIMNGLEALKKIMETNPLPVIMLSSTTKEGTDNTLTAMQLGAFDFIAKPSGAISLDLHKIKEEIVSKVVLASQTPKHRLTNLTMSKSFTVKLKESYSKIDIVKTPKLKEGITTSTHRYLSEKIVSIGTSTGGPRALQTVLTKLPKDIPAPIIIVQHMPPGFTKSLATRLDSICEIEVKEAENNEILKNGVAYIAPGGYHLKLKKIGSDYTIQLDQSEPRNGHRPSVDVMFESVALIPEIKKVAVVMTGMGSDGSKGLIEMKKNGNLIAISESKETSIVYGMPKAAFETGIVDEVQDVENIAKSIMKYV